MGNQGELEPFALTGADDFQLSLSAKVICKSDVFYGASTFFPVSCRK